MITQHNKFDWNCVRMQKFYYAFYKRRMQLCNCVWTWALGNDPFTNLYLIEFKLSLLFYDFMSVDEI